jgi:hypothetical protein
MYGFGDDEFVKRQKELQQMKFGLDDLQKSFDEMPGMKLGSYDVTGRENPNPETTLGKTDLTNLLKSDNGGLESLLGGLKTGGSESIGGEAGGIEALAGSAGGGMDIASTSVAAGMKALTMSQTTANNDGESVMNGIDMTMKGAQAGMAIGGPWGAAIGGALGLGYGIYDGFADANKRGRNERNANKEKFNENRLRREQEFRISEGEESLKKLSALRKSQMDYLI